MMLCLSNMRRSVKSSKVQADTKVDSNIDGEDAAP